MITITIKGDPELVETQLNALITAGKTILSIIKTKNNSTYLVIHTP